MSEFVVPRSIPTIIKPFSNFGEQFHGEKGNTSDRVTAERDSLRGVPRSAFGVPPKAVLPMSLSTTCGVPAGCGTPRAGRDVLPFHPFTKRNSHSDNWDFHRKRNADDDARSA